MDPRVKPEDDKDEVKPEDDKLLTVIPNSPLSFPGLTGEPIF
jgi:hypothetical protein